MTPFVLIPLWALCVTDAGFAGYRAAAGRDARIFKAESERRAVRRGLLSGIVTSLIVGAVVTLAIVIAPAPAIRFGELVDCGRWMLWPLGVYATAVLGALGVWMVAEADLRTLASVIVLGPFTLIRPIVIVGAGALAAWHSPSLAAALVVVLACGLQLAIEPWLGRSYARPTATAMSGFRD